MQFPGEPRDGGTPPMRVCSGTASGGRQPPVFEGPRSPDRGLTPPARPDPPLLEQTLIPSPSGRPNARHRRALGRADGEVAAGVETRGSPGDFIRAVIACEIRSYASNIVVWPPGEPKPIRGQDIRRDSGWVFPAGIRTYATDEVSCDAPSYTIPPHSGLKRLCLLATGTPGLIEKLPNRRMRPSAPLGTPSRGGRPSRKPTPPREPPAPFTKRGGAKRRHPRPWGATKPGGDRGSQHLGQPRLFTMPALPCGLDPIHPGLVTQILWWLGSSEL